jgi:hypothetical protein
MKSLLPWTKLHLYIDLTILNKGYVSLLLKSSLQNFYRPHHELIRRLGVTKYPLFRWQWITSVSCRCFLHVLYQRLNYMSNDGGH